MGSTLTSPRSGEPDGPAGMNPPSSARRIWSISPSVRRSRGTTSVAANAQHRSDVGVVGEPRRRRRRPSPVGLHRGDQLARRGLGLRRRRASVVGAVLGQAQRLPQARAAHARRRTAGGPAGWPAPGRVRPAPVGAWPRTCRPSRIWTSLISHSQPSTCSSMSSNASSSGRSVSPRSWSIFAARISVQICCADGGQLAGVERGDVGVLVEQLLQPRDVAVGLGARHRRDEVVDQHGVRPALGLGALTGIVDQERIDQRQVAQRGVGAARRRHAQCLARQPLQVAVLAEVHDGVAPRTRLSQPAVGGQVVVAGRQVGIVVDRDGVLAEAARRLDHQHDVAGLHCGDDDLAVGIVAAVDEQLAGRRAPVLRSPRRSSSAGSVANQSR